MRHLILTMAVAAIVSAATAAPPLYHVVNLGTLDGATYVRGLNESGQVVGYSVLPGNIRHAFLYSNGSMIDLGTLGGTHSVAEGINDLGEVVGQADLGGQNVRSHAFVYRNGVMTDLGTLGGVTSHAYGIDSVGRIVGVANNGLRDRAFMFDAGVMNDLGTLSPTNRGNSSALNISPSGIVAGASETGAGDSVAALFINGSKVNLGTLGGFNAAAHDVNDSGQAVGISQIVGGTPPLRAFLYSSGVMMNLGTLGENSFGEGINSFGEVVGGSFLPGGVTEHGFIYTSGTMFDLNNYLHPKSSGWVISSAEDINDKGWIVAHGSYPGVGARGVLLIPVPEPGAVWLIICCTFVIAAKRCFVLEARGGGARAAGDERDLGSRLVRRRGLRRGVGLVCRAAEIHRMKNSGDPMLAICAFGHLPPAKHIGARCLMNSQRVFGD